VTTLVSGFTFIKNALDLGYPIRESILSIEALCDEIIINVGFEDPECQKDDGTYEYLRDHFNHKKFIFLKNWWDPQVSRSGLILSQQTNLALEKCRGKYGQYIQGDEAIHEDDLKIIHGEIIDLEKKPHIEGLIFRYIHLYGNVDTYLNSRNVYRREVRTIRLNQERRIQSHLDAQGFRKEAGEKIKAKQIEARIFHYGWAREEKVMKRKTKAFDKLYHGSDFENPDEFQYEKIWGLRKFKHSHPQVMMEWIEKNRNSFNIDQYKTRLRLKDLRLIISDGIEKFTGIRMGEFKNFDEIS
jgi:hypothetical protein